MEIRLFLKESLTEGSFNALLAHTHTPDTRSKPVVRRSLFLGLLYLLGIFKVPQNAIRVDIRVIFSGYSLKPKKANNELHRLWMSIHGISRLSAS